MEKKEIWKATLGTISASYPDGVKVRRSGGNCFAEVGDCNVCFNIQADKYQPDEGVRFMIEWGVTPKVVFETNPEGLFGKNPSYLDAYYRRRLKQDPNNSMSDRFTVRTEDDLANALRVISDLLEELWRDHLNDMVELSWHVSEMEKDRRPITQVYLAIIKGEDFRPYLTKIED